MTDSIAQTFGRQRLALSSTKEVPQNVRGPFSASQGWTLYIPLVWVVVFVVLFSYRKFCIRKPVQVSFQLL